MALSLFCKHDNYEVITWKYVNIGKYDQYIEARVKCDNCGKIVTKKIEGERAAVFAVIYDDKFGQ
jgi:lysyl-tRNA synthetase class I